MEEQPKYGCGNAPMVGDLIEFGSRHERLLVSRILEDGASFGISCDGHEYGAQSLSLMKLIARHGTAVPSDGASRCLYVFDNF